MNPILAGMTLLIIGDSHMASPGSLISSLHDEMTQRGAVVYSYGVCGVQPGNWASAPMASCGAASRQNKGPVQVATTAQSRGWRIDGLIHDHRPSMVIIVMGDTVAGYGMPSVQQAWVQSQVATLTNAIAATGTACAWVGPAWGREGGAYGKTYARAQQIANELATDARPCIYVDSLAMSKPGQWDTADGLHFTRGSYQAWGQAIAERLSGLKPSAQVAERPKELKALSVGRAN